MLKAHGEPLLSLIEVRDLVERAKFPCFSALTVIYVQKGKMVLLMGNRSSDAAIHAAAHEHDRKFFHALSLPVLSPEFYTFRSDESCQERGEKNPPMGQNEKRSIGGTEGTRRESMGPVNEHGETPGTDNLFFPFMEARKIHPLFVLRAAHETFELYRCHVNPPGR